MIIKTNYLHIHTKGTQGNYNEYYCILPATTWNAWCCILSKKLKGESEDNNNNGHMYLQIKTGGGHVLWGEQRSLSE